MKRIIRTIITAALLFTFSISLFASDTSEVITKVLSNGTVVKRSSVELFIDEDVANINFTPQKVNASVQSNLATSNPANDNLSINVNGLAVDSDTGDVTTEILPNGTVVKRSSVELVNKDNDGASSYSMSIGTGYVEGEDPLFGKPRAHAVTGAYQGSYRVSAKCDVLNSDGSSYTTDWVDEYNAVVAITSTIYAGTDSCTFTGFYEIELTQGGISSFESSSLSF